MKLAALLPLLIILVPSNVFASTNAKINEFLVHPGSGDEWVEFYNPDQIDLSTYFLDDDTDFSSDSGSSSKKNLSAINNSNLTYPYLEFGSFLNNDSDYVVLFAPDGSIEDQYQYSSDPGSDVTIGRSPDGSGQFSTLTSQTRGAGNTNPVPTSDPTPTPNPSPSPTPTPTPTPANSPVPTPIKSPSPSPKPTPKSSPSPSSQTSTILGETSDTNPSPNPSPSPEAKSGTLSKTKAAAIITGAGALLIALSFGFYLWYSKLLGNEKSPKGVDFEEVPQESTN